MDKYSTTIKELRGYGMKLVKLRNELNANEESDLIELFNQAIDSYSNLIKGICRNVEKRTIN